MEEEEYTQLMEQIGKLKKAFNDKDYLELTNTIFLLENTIKHFRLNKELQG